MLFRSLFYAGYQKWTSILTVFVQMFIVSRVFKHLGVRAALFVLPAIALGGYALVSIFPVLAAFRALKVTENATDYSLNNTLRNVLWLPTTRLQKYVGKQAVDTFFVRSGDVASAICVYLMADRLKLGIPAFGILSLALILVGFEPITAMLGRWASPGVIESVASFSVLTHFDGFQKGVLDTRDLLYFLSVIGFALFTTGVIVRNRRAG